MTDVASLALEIDSSSAVTMKTNQDAATESGEKLESQVNRLSVADQAYQSVAQRTGETLAQVRSRYEAATLAAQNRGMAESSNAVASIRAAEAMAAQEKGVQKLIDRYDPLGYSLRRLLAEQQALSQSMGDSVKPEVMKAFQGLEEDIEKTTKAMKDAEGGIDGAGKKLSGFQAITARARTDILQMGNALARGDFEMAGRQVLQLATNSWEMVRSFVAMLAPAVAVAGVLAVLGKFVYEWEVFNREIGKTEALLAGVGRAGSLTRAELSSYSLALQRTVGITEEASFKIIGSFARQSGVGRDTLDELIGMVPDFARAIGSEAPAAAEKLAKAFDSPIAGAKALDKEMNLLTFDQYKQVLAMEKVGDQSGASALLMKALHDRVDGLRNEGLTPLEKAWGELRSAFKGTPADVDQANVNLAKNISLFADFVRTVKNAGQELKNFELARLRSLPPSPETNAQIARLSHKSPEQLEAEREAEIQAEIELGERNSAAIEAAEKEKDRLKKESYDKQQALEKERLEETKRMREIDAAGWVKHIEFMIKEYEDGIHAQIKIDADAQKARDKIRADNLKAVQAAQKIEDDARKFGADFIIKEGKKVEDALKRLNAFMAPSLWRDFGRSLASSFGEAGSAIASMTAALDDFAAREKEIAAARKDADTAYANDPQKRAELEIEFANKSAQAQMTAYADIAGAAKYLFKEHSTGYKVMEGVEKVFRAMQMALALQSYVTEIGQMLGLTAVKATTTTTNIGLEATETAASISMSGTRTIASTVAGVAKAFEQMGVWGFVGAAAILAFMASLGANAGGGGSAPSISEDRQRRQGTGTVLGDGDAKSDSLLNALEILRDNSSADLQYASGMLSSLRAIESYMGGLAAVVARDLRITGGNTEGLGLGGGTTLGWGSTRSLADTGIVVNPQTVGQARQGLSANAYADVETTRTSWFGLSSRTSTSRQLQELEEGTSREMTRIVEAMAQTVTEGFVVLFGDKGEEMRVEIERVLNGLNLSITEISFRDLEGEDIQDAVAAVFSALGDQMVSGVAGSFADLAALESFQQVGEGMFETLVRVASGVERAGATLDQWGIAMVDWRELADKQGDVTTELIRESVVLAETQDGLVSGVGDLVDAFDGTAEEIVNLYNALRYLRDMMRDTGIDVALLGQELITAAGGADNLIRGVEVYSANFFTAQEQAAARMVRLRESMAFLNEIGREMPSDRAGMRDLIDFLEESGDTENLGRVLALVPAWDSVYQAAEDAAREARESWLDIMDLIDELEGGSGGDQRRMDSAVAQAASVFGVTGSFDQIVTEFVAMAKDPDTWSGFTDSQRDLISAILGLAVDVRGNTQIQQQIHSAYSVNPNDVVAANFADFERRFGGVIGSQDTTAGSISLESTLISEQMAANERRRKQIEQQFQGYQLPPEYYALDQANQKWAERLRQLGVDLGRITVLTAQYGEETGSAIFGLENWYEEQKRIIGDNQTALLALQEIYEQQRADIIEGQLEETVDEIVSMMEDLRRWRAGLLLSDASPLTAQQRLDFALEQYNAAQAAASAAQAAASAAGAGSEEYAAYKAAAEAYMREGSSFFGRASTEYGAIFARILQESGILSGELSEPVAISDPYRDYGNPIPVLQAIQQTSAEEGAKLREELQAQIESLKETVMAAAEVQAQATRDAAYTASNVAEARR